MPSLPRIFPDYISFYKTQCKNNEKINFQLHKLDNIIFKASSNNSLAIVFSNTNIKNNIIIFVAHVYLYNSLVRKTIHHVINIISTEAELFTIRYGINQAIQISEISYIIVITDAIHIVQKIFNLLIYSY